MTDENMFYKAVCKLRRTRGNYATYAEICEIADEIEERHEEEYVELPKDADGVPIHVGDKMTGWTTRRYMGNLGSTSYVIADAPVRCLTLKEDGWEVSSDIQRTKPQELRHFYEPTVEDVLREFTDAILEWAGKSGTVAETGTWNDVADSYIAKLRLADSEE